MRIGEWWIRPAEGLVERNGQAVRLRPRAMDVLALLATRPGHAVSKEEIFAEVWAGNAVEDGALAHCISEIRTALGDAPRSPRYIETIPKRGYRLVAPVAPGAAAPAAPAPAALVRPFQRRTGRAVARLVAGLGGTAVLAWLLAAAIERETPERTAAAAAGPDRRPRVAVLGFSNLSGDPEARWLSTALSELLTTEIAVSEVVKPVPGDSVARIQRELSIAGADRVEADALAQLRAGLGVDYVVVGSYLVAGEGSGEIRIENPNRLGATLAGLGSVRMIAGDLEEAEELLEETLRLREQLGDPIRTSFGLSSLARLRLAQGDPRQAERLAREAASTTDGAPDYYRVRVRRDLAFILLETGRPEEARGILIEREEPLDSAAAVDLSLLSARITLARALGATGDQDRGHELLEGVVAYAESKGLERLRLEAELARFEIGGRGGLDEPGQRRLRAFAERLRRHGLELLARRADELLAASKTRPT